MTWLSVERPVGRIGAQAAAFLVSRGVLLVATIVVARDAGIEAYGLFALAMIVYQAGLLLRDAGLGQGLIVSGQERGMGWAAFLAITGTGVGLALLMAVIGTAVAEAVGAPELGHVQRVLALAFAIGSAGVASNSLLERSLRFVARAWIDVAAYAALGVVTGLGLSAGLGVQSLAWGFVAQAIVQTVVGLVLAPPWRERGAGVAAFVRFARYGSLLWAVAGLAYVAANLDNALVGWLGGAAALGAYALAYTIGNTITIGPAQVINRVALPYYGAARDDREAIRGMMRSVIPVSAALGLVPAAAITWLAPEIARIVLADAVPVGLVVLLAVYGVIRSVALALGTAANGIGAARRTVEGSLLNVVVMAVGIPIGYAFAGLTGVGIAVTAAIGLAGAYLLIALERETGARAREAALLGTVATGGWLAAALLGADLPLAVRVVLLGLTWAVAVILIVGATGVPGRLRRAGAPRP